MPPPSEADREVILVRRGSQALLLGQCHRADAVSLAWAHGGFVVSVQRHLCNGMRCASDVEPSELARGQVTGRGGTHMFTGADLAGLCRRAVTFAVMETPDATVRASAGSGVAACARW